MFPGHFLDICPVAMTDTQLLLQRSEPCNCPKSVAYREGLL